MNPKGHVWINREFVHTTLWPNPQVTLQGEIDLEKEYKEALAGQLVTVMDIAVDDSAYLVLGESKSAGQFIWNIEKGDTKGFIPVIKKNGILMPAGMGVIEEMLYTAEHQMREMENYNEREINKCKSDWEKTKEMPRKMKKRLRKEILSIYNFHMYFKEKGWF